MASGRYTSPPDDGSVDTTTTTTTTTVVAFDQCPGDGNGERRCGWFPKEHPDDGNGQTLRRCVPRTLSWRRKRANAASVCPENAVLATETGSGCRAVAQQRCPGGGNG